MVGGGGSGERWLSPSQRCSQLQLCICSFKTLSARRPQLAIRTSNKNCIFARGRCVAAAVGPLASRGRRRAGSGDESIARRNNYTRRLDRFSFQEVWLEKTVSALLRNQSAVGLFLALSQPTQFQSIHRRDYEGKLNCKLPGEASQGFPRPTETLAFISTVSLLKPVNLLHTLV